MTNEVADAVTENMAEAVHTSVYDAYSPQYYKRRMNNGGLSDVRNIDVTEIQNGIAVHDAASLDNGRNDYNLDEIIVYGLGNQPFERDFYAETVERLQENQEHTEALKQGLKKRGIMIE